MGDELIRREKYLKNCKPAMIKSRKSGSNINAKPSIEALKAEARAIVAELSGGFQPNYLVA